MKRNLISAFLSLIIFFPSIVKANNNFASIKLEGTVNPIIAEHIVKSIDRANVEKAAFIVIKLDTPGGLMTSMREIIKSIMSSKIPVIVYTYPKGAQAASAGGYIMISAHIAAMAPGTEIGAMHPVSPFLNFGQKDEQGRDQDGIMEKKVINDTLAYGRSIAQKKNRNAQWVEYAIKDAISSTYIEAKKLGVIDIVAEDMNDLLSQLDGMTAHMDDGNIRLSTKNITETAYEMDIKTEFLNFFADPQIIFVLFIIAVIGIWTEIKNPGMIVPGVLGALSFFMFLLAIRAIPINIAGIILIVTAIVLFVLELKFISYGLLTIGGIISFVAGAMILFDSPLPGFEIPVATIAAVVVFILFFIFIVVRSILNAHKAKITTGIDGLIGERGTALADFNDTGKVMVHGEIWNARTIDVIKKNDSIEILNVDQMTLDVKKINN